MPQDFVGKLDLLGFSGIANLSMAIKFSKYYELTGDDVVLTVLTDSMDLYQSRLEEMRAEYGQYTRVDAAAHYARYLQGLTSDHLLELRYSDRRRVHNLKYFTWSSSKAARTQKSRTNGINVITGPTSKARSTRWTPSSKRSMRK